jgi:hypothetical protein
MNQAGYVGTTVRAAIDRHDRDQAASELVPKGNKPSARLGEPS